MYCQQTGMTRDPASCVNKFDLVILWRLFHYPKTGMVSAHLIRIVFNIKQDNICKMVSPEVVTHCVFINTS